MSLYLLDPREQLIDVALVDGRLVISIGIDFLTRVVVDVLNDYQPDSQIKLIDPNQFADTIRCGLLHEKDDGSTLVNLMFEAAADLALEDGRTEGIEFLAEPLDSVIDE